jgi:3-hydroxyisobutyrate dehydrogenase
MNIGFIGLGKMGYNIAMNLSKKYNTYVWNRTESVSLKHSKEFNTIFTKEITDLTKKCDIIFMCLPTFKEVDLVISKLYNHIRYDQIIIDCTSSVPKFQKEMAVKLSLKNAYYFDCPISGGPEKAFKGNLSSMVGGDYKNYYKIEEVLQTFSNPKYVGNIGNGCAIKAINNLMNVTNLCVAAEGLETLNKLGIDKKIALEVINKSSGRSLMTQERFPVHILEKNYNYGFKLGLMRKDVQIALDMIEDPKIISNIKSLLDISIEKYGHNGDYTEVTKIFK